MEAIWNISGMYSYPVKCFCVEFLLDFWLAMMHQYGYRYWYNMGRGMGIQHFLKNLEYDTLEIRQILLSFFPPSPVSYCYSLYLWSILRISKPYQNLKKSFFSLDTLQVWLYPYQYWVRVGYWYDGKNAVSVHQSWLMSLCASCLQF